MVTDEPLLINEALSKYPEYEFAFDYKASLRAKYERIRILSVYDALISMHLLSRCNFVVCTLSSNMCRRVQEIMEVYRNGDLTGTLVKSLDLQTFPIYPFQGYQIAIADHRPDSIANDEIELEVGDILLPEQKLKFEVSRVRNLFDGYIKGTNKRTGKLGRYPHYKVQYKWF